MQPPPDVALPLPGGRQAEVRVTERADERRGGGEPVTPDWLNAGNWEVDIAGVRHPVEVSLRPMYDPTSARIKV